MEEETYRSQFRLPYSLYEKLKAASENNRRSLNAELVARLEESTTKDAPPSELLPAEKLREIASVARRDISAEIRKVVLDDMRRAAANGQGSSTSEFPEYELDGLSDEERAEFHGALDAELLAAGYEFDWDGDTLYIRF